MPCPFDDQGLCTSNLLFSLLWPCSCPAVRCFCLAHSSSACSLTNLTYPLHATLPLLAESPVPAHEPRGASARSPCICLLAYQQSPFSFMAM
ncbi:hypothetical protein J1614_009077 [Plenodomus biglobosus]|nr:hypothetical protein J1614_009077 [Plenodomus biglobosus]